MVFSRSNDIIDINEIPSYNAQSTVVPTVINKPAPVKQPNFMNGNGHAVSPVTTASAIAATSAAPAGAVLLHTPNGIKQPPTPLLPHWQNNGKNDANSDLSNSMQNINLNTHNGYRR